MKRINLVWCVLLTMAIGVSSCMKDVSSRDEEKIAENEAAIQAALQADSLGSKAVRDSTGYYYIIRKSNPSGLKAQIGDAATIKYTGYTLNGTKVISSTEDNKTEFSFPVNGGVYWPGIELGIFKLKTGEQATLYLPFYLASGAVDRVNIPAYTPIRLEVEFIKTRTELQQIDDFITKKGYTVSERTPDNLVIVRANTVTGDTIGIGKSVNVKYVGRLLDDTKFDENTSSFITGSPNTIPGFDRAIRKMKKGEKAVIIFPSKLGYGKNWTKSILPYSPLQFEIEIQ
ncbi:FKBP-type peptidyl-prolyl cis-trans isomerase [Dyadobacter sp. BE34]|uniref:Peptidyl-prolyl cis-trans isomerase n=1 Tax=Dyadobacter fermentans TaxID=94254 RepID=A0ABU1R323_9BACT|nr:MULTISPECIES: FKBP-type peptidyl-prolyl cis-trans isomerase [Dyadobacter]MDR6807809.1 FKBP-type peptidyl-prolyl cis-trans isomerase [Dyadobacter fermentans]MDR7045550.1 FKBP-type peptidyl-prolyl cis-trans isomerase [Dyadobacter sp. BE242]MDR7199863.1 FKBP-type peptidyl-prolyl cis-trans isomerase [Dyadobacter sp. BE34]MDR7217678.1 FKBP-type peptidyl-prolyl cis-trans isomerase [Dyadobacter sp. BE31]MDR7265754.1 FKBP-type peptidyl-prolyl cis-trans isomerase [Dyadobacter sp. BE32]